MKPYKRFQIAIRLLQRLAFEMAKGRVESFTMENAPEYVDDHDGGYHARRMKPTGRETITITVDLRPLHPDEKPYKPPSWARKV